MHTHNCGNIVGECLVICAGAHTLKVIAELLREKAKLSQLYFGQGISCTVTGDPDLPHTIRPEIPSQRDIALGIRGILSAALEPDGQLPYNNFEELEIFMTELFKLAVCDDANEEMRQQVRHLFQEIPLDEQGMVRILNEVLKRNLPEDQPFAGESAVREEVPSLRCQQLGDGMECN